MDNSSRKINPPFTWQQKTQGRLTDSDDSMTITIRIQANSEYFDQDDWRLDNKRNRVHCWTSWSKLNQKVVWDD